MYNIVGYDTDLMKWVRLFTWTRDAQSGLDRAETQRHLFKGNYVAFLAFKEGDETNADMVIVLEDILDERFKEEQKTYQ